MPIPWHHADVESERLLEGHLTFYECPVCEETWQAEEAIPGLLHGYIMCERCRHVAHWTPIVVPSWCVH